MRFIALRATTYDLIRRTMCFLYSSETCKFNQSILLMPMSNNIDHAHLSATTSRRCRIRSNLRGDIDYDCERWPGCGRAATDHQRLNTDAEEDHWRFSVVQQDLGAISWRVWISDRQRQLLAGTWQGLPSGAAGQRQTQSWGRAFNLYLFLRRIIITTFWLVPLPFFFRAVSCIVWVWRRLVVYHRFSVLLF